MRFFYINFFIIIMYMTQLQSYLLQKINEPDCPLHFIELYHALF